MRPSKDRYLMALAEVAASRTTCIRKGVGAVLADAKGRVLAIAYNGVAAGQPHCNETKEESVYIDDPRVVVNMEDLSAKFNGQTTRVWRSYLNDGIRQCVGFESTLPHACDGHDHQFGEPTSCEAIHAEQNAVLQCRNTDAIHTAYVTTAPCKPCMKLLLNTGCRRIVFLEDHPGSEEARVIWEKAGREWLRLQEA